MYPQAMTEKDKPEQTTPTGFKIRIPTRGEFMRNLKKTAKRPPDSTPDRPKK